MSVIQAQVTIASDGTPIPILAGNTANANQVFVRNTGSVTVLIGPTTYLPPPINIVLTPSAGSGSFAAGTYFWQVTALNAYGQTQGSAEQFATIALNGKCLVAWDAVTGATSYKVYRSTTTGGEATSPALIVTQGGISYNDTGTGPSTGAVSATNTAQVPLLYPLATNESVQFPSSANDFLTAQVKTAGGGAGQITILKVG